MLTRQSVIQCASRGHAIVDLNDQFSSGIGYTLGPRGSTQIQTGLAAASGVGPDLLGRGLLGGVFGLGLASGEVATSDIGHSGVQAFSFTFG